MKAFRREPMVAVSSACETDGWLFDTELVLRAERLGLRIDEIPVDISEIRQPGYWAIVRRVPEVVEPAARSPGADRAESHGYQPEPGNPEPEALGPQHGLGIEEPASHSGTGGLTATHRLTAERLHAVRIRAAEAKRHAQECVEQPGNRAPDESGRRSEARPMTFEPTSTSHCCSRRSAAAANSPLQKSRL